MRTCPELHLEYHVPIEVLALDLCHGYWYLRFTVNRSSSIKNRLCSWNDMSLWSSVNVGAINIRTVPVFSGPSFRTCIRRKQLKLRNFTFFSFLITVTPKISQCPTSESLNLPLYCRRILDVANVRITRRGGWYHWDLKFQLVLVSSFL